MRRLYIYALMNHGRWSRIVENVSPLSVPEDENTPPDTLTSPASLFPLASLFFHVSENSKTKEKGCGATLSLLGKEVWSVSMFIDPTFNKNQVEYKILLMGLQEARDRNVLHLIVKSDCLVVLFQMKGQYHVYDPLLWPLFQACKGIELAFQKTEYVFIHKEDNLRAIRLAKVGRQLPQLSAK